MNWLIAKVLRIIHLYFCSSMKFASNLRNGCKYIYPKASHLRRLPLNSKKKKKISYIQSQLHHRKLCLVGCRREACIPKQRICRSLRLQKRSGYPQSSAMFVLTIRLGRVIEMTRSIVSQLRVSAE